jgi:hypothetical protein
MTPRLRPILIAALLALVAGPAASACYADYRAQKSDPFSLHYGVIEIPDSACSAAAAGPVIAGRIAADGWELLQVISVFDAGGLDARRADAGAYFLRY